MRLSVRPQEGGSLKLIDFDRVELSRAITDGIRGAEIANGINAQRRSMDRLRAIDEATGGALCKKIDELIEGETKILTKDLETGTVADVKAVRTEIGRLASYLRYRDACHGLATVP